MGLAFGSALVGSDDVVTAPAVPWPKAGNAGATLRDDEGTPSMWAFFSRRLRTWLLLAIALPLAQALVHRLALAAERRDPSTRTAKTLH